MEFLSEQNLAQVMRMRNGGPGWGRVTGGVEGVKLGRRRYSQHWWRVAMCACCVGVCECVSGGVRLHRVSECD